MTSFEIFSPQILHAEPHNGVQDSDAPLPGSFLVCVVSNNSADGDSNAESDLQTGAGIGARFEPGDTDQPTLNLLLVKQQSASSTFSVESAPFPSDEILVGAASIVYSCDAAPGTESLPSGGSIGAGSTATELGFITI
jgi:hypothetical protein